MSRMGEECPRRARLGEPPSQGKESVACGMPGGREFQGGAEAGPESHS